LHKGYDKTKNILNMQMDYMTSQTITKNIDKPGT